MVQVINLGPSRGQLQAEILGQGANQLAQGLGEFTSNYLAGKSLDDLANDESLKDAPLSERWAAAQSRMAKYGERGQRLLQQHMQLARQKQVENAVNQMKKDIQNGVQKDYRQQYLELLPSLLDNPTLAGELAQVMFKPQQAGIIPGKPNKPSPGKSTKVKPTGPKGNEEMPIPEQMDQNIEPIQESSNQQNIIPPPQTPKTNRQMAEEFESRYRNPQKPVSERSTFPGSPLQEQYQEPLTAEQIQVGAEDIVNRTQGMANPVNYDQALQMMRNQNQTIESHNANVTNQKRERLSAQEDQYNRFLKRADDAGYDTSNNPEMKSVIQKLALSAKDFEDENQAWDYIRPKIKEVSDAVNSIRTSSSPLRNPFTKMFSDGRVKSMQEYGEGIKNDINTLKKYGMYEELRNLLTGSVGLGPEQSENLIFPFEGDAKNQLDAFSKNPKKVKEDRYGFALAGEDLSNIFPGESHSLPQKEFRNFENQVGEYLNSNPGVNLVALRGQLNQGKRYSWQNISSAISNLIDSGVWNPDPAQVEQLKIIKEPPIPGIAEAFKYQWKGRK